MTRREVITKAIDAQLSWVAAVGIIGVMRSLGEALGKSHQTVIAVGQCFQG